MSDLENRTDEAADATDPPTGPIKAQDAKGADVSNERPHRPFIPHMIRLFAVPIILGWVAITVLVNVAVPTLEVVGEAHSAPMAPLDAPSMKAMMRLGHNFKEFDSNSTIMIVLERSGTPRSRRASLLRQPDSPTAAGSQPHPAHPGLLG